MFAPRVVEAVDVFEEGDLDLSPGVPVVGTLEKRQGLETDCPEEIDYEAGWINEEPCANRRRNTRERLWSLFAGRVGSALTKPAQQGRRKQRSRAGLRLAIQAKTGHFHSRGRCRPAQQRPEPV